MCAIYPGASGRSRWKAPLDEHLLQGHWPKPALREGVNRQKLRVLEERLRVWGEPIWRKLALVSMDNASAVVYATHGAGCSPNLTRLARAS